MFSLGMVFPWVGLGAAAVLLVLLARTPLLREDPGQPRHRDGTWLAWCAAVAYLLHNGEEYGLDLFGNVFAFPAAMEALMPQAAALPTAFYVAVNVSIFWFAAPLAAARSRGRPFLQLSMAGILLVNAAGHIGQFFIIGYTPGLVTSAVLFLPLSLWMLLAVGRSVLPRKALAAVMGIGVVTHVVLIGSMFAFLSGFLSAGAVTAIQVGNAALYLLLSLLGDRVFPGARTLRA